MGIETMIPSLAGEGFFTTQVNKIIGWARKSSLFPYPFGTACCAIEMMSTFTSRYDLSRFGAEVLRFSPRQSDLMIVSGRVTLKMMPVLSQIYMQMAEPKWVISMGACASTGGVFNTYPQIQGVDQFIPVDVYIPGCPPRPESLIDAVMKIRMIIDGQAERGEFTRTPEDNEKLAKAAKEKAEKESSKPASSEKTDKEPAVETKEEATAETTA